MLAVRRVFSLPFYIRKILAFLEAHSNNWIRKVKNLSGKKGTENFLLYRSAKRLRSSVMEMGLYCRESKKKPVT